MNFEILLVIEGIAPKNYCGDLIIHKKLIEQSPQNKIYGLQNNEMRVELYELDDHMVEEFASVINTDFLQEINVMKQKISGIKKAKQKLKNFQQLQQNQLISQQISALDINSEINFFEVEKELFMQKGIDQNQHHEKNEFLTIVKETNSENTGFTTNTAVNYENIHQIGKITSQSSQETQKLSNLQKSDSSKVKVEVEIDQIKNQNISFMEKNRLINQTIKKNQKEKCIEIDDDKSMYADDDIMYADDDKSMYAEDDYEEDENNIYSKVQMNVSQNQNNQINILIMDNTFDEKDNETDSIPEKNQSMLINSQILDDL